jgi:hypothetical protein
MCYWFERDGDYLRCEVHDTGDRYELRIVKPDGTERIELYADSARLYVRQVKLEQRLLNHGWNGPHGRNA